MNHLILSHIMGPGAQYTKSFKQNLVDFKNYVILTDIAITEDFFVKGEVYMGSDLKFFGTLVYINTEMKGIYLNSLPEGFSVIEQRNTQYGVFVNGLEEGIWTTKTPDGEIISEKTLSKGIPNRFFVEYSKGLISRKGCSYNGYGKEFTTFYKNGLPSETVRYIDGEEIES